MRAPTLTHAVLAVPTTDLPLPVAGRRTDFASLPVVNRPLLGVWLRLLAHEGIRSADLLVPERLKHVEAVIPNEYQCGVKTYVHRVSQPERALHSPALLERLTEGPALLARIDVWPGVLGLHALVHGTSQANRVLEGRDELLDCHVLARPDLQLRQNHGVVACSDAFAIRSLGDYVRANIDAIHWLDRISGLEEHCATALMLAPQAGIADDARVCAPALIGSRCRIERGAELTGGVVIGDDSFIGREAHLTQCVVLPGTKVPAGARYTGCVVGPEGSISWQVGARTTRLAFGGEESVAPSAGNGSFDLGGSTTRATPCPPSSPGVQP